MLVSTEGIVLKQRKIANNRRIIVLFTKKYGKISAGTNINEKGRGKSALALRPFALSEYELYKKGSFYNINGTELKESHYSIGEKLDRFMAASSMINYVEKVVQEEQSNPKLFDLSRDFLEFIARADANFETLLLAFYVQSLTFLGIMPELKHCVNCGEKFEGLDYLFSIEAGGGICKKCIANMESLCNPALIFKPNFDIIGTIDYFANNPLKRFTKVSLKEQFIIDLKKILNEYIKYYLDIDILESDLGL